CAGLASTWNSPRLSTRRSIISSDWSASWTSCCKWRASGLLYWGATAGLPSSAAPWSCLAVSCEADACIECGRVQGKIKDGHCWASQQWHPQLSSNQELHHATRTCHLPVGRGLGSAHADQELPGDRLCRRRASHHAQTRRRAI